MFKIEAFLGTILEKTEKVSLCSLVEASSRRFQKLEDYQEEFSKIFFMPEGCTSQYIFHGFSEKKPKGKREAEKDAVTTIFSLEKGVFGINKF